MQFLGIKISEVTKDEALSKVVEFLNSSKQYKIFTPNPEMVVKAQQDEYFKTVLNSGDMNLCDGMGLQIFTVIARIPGVDFMLDVCRLAAEQGRGIYLLGSGKDEVVEKTKERLQIKFSGLKIAGWNKGPNIDELRIMNHELSTHSASHNSKFILHDSDLPEVKRENQKVLDSINESKAEILFVAFGMGKQEKWIYENLSKLPNITVVMGVGGSFDFISGKIKRAPLFLRKLGLEWVYRLIQQPRRIGRILNATIKFTYLVLRSKI